MKVVWYSHHREESGWADASINSILALDSVGVEVVPVNIPLSNPNGSAPDRIAELEKGSKEGADYCVQNVLPHLMVATDMYKKNIGYFVSETLGLQHTCWMSPLSQMDEVWTPNTWNSKCVAADLGNNNVYTIPYAFNITEYEGLYDTLDLGAANDSYKFYYIGDLNDRKNLEATLRCYQATFRGSPNVTLVLKIGSHGKSPQETAKITNEMVARVNQSLRMFRDPNDYCNVVVISDRLSRKQILDLHNTCDCYVSTSHGEGWGLPIFEAACMGNAVIAGEEGGPYDFLADTGFLVDGGLGPCTHRDSAFPFIGTGYELWFNIDEADVMAHMQQHYSQREDYRKQGLQIAKRYSYNKIGEQMKARLLK